MAISPALFSSATDAHPTPADLFSQLDAEFKFNLDAAASWENKKTLTYFGPDHVLPEMRDGLAAKWMGKVWCNPPYGSGELPCQPKCKKKRCPKRGYCITEEIDGVEKWVQKAAMAAKFGAVEHVVMLLPARTDTQWFHTYCVGDTEIRFIKGRLKFGDATNSAPFPSMVVIWRGPERDTYPYQMLTVRT